MDDVSKPTVSFLNKCLPSLCLKGGAFYDLISHLILEFQYSHVINNCSSFSETIVMSNEDRRFCIRTAMVFELRTIWTEYVSHQELEKYITRDLHSGRFVDIEIWCIVYLTIVQLLGYVIFSTSERWVPISTISDEESGI